MVIITDMSEDRAAIEARALLETRGLHTAAYKDGEPVTDDWFSKLENDKLFAALLALFYAALAGWQRKDVFGRKGRLNVVCPISKY